MFRCPLLPALALVLAVSTLAAHAGWSNDPAVNTAIAAKVSDQIQPKVLPIPSGGWYVSWFDSDPAGSPPFGYDVFLQRLDANGDPVWAPAGIRIADRGVSSTEDYGLDVDGSGNALLAFGDDRVTPQQITATKVDLTGAQVWGPNGIQVSTGGTGDVHSPKITATTDGQIVVAWTSVKDIKLHRMTSAGATVWDRTISPPSGRNYALADLHASDSGSAIFSWVRTDTSGNRHILAQKYSSAGAPVWSPVGGVVVFDGGSLQLGNFPDFVSDGSGGAAFGWYTLAQQCWAQHVTSAGAEAFGHNGAAASTDATHSRVSAEVQFVPATGETLLFFVEQSGGLQGVYGQKFNATGVRQWTNNGKVARALGSVSISSLRPVVVAGTSLVFWIDEPTFAHDQLFAARLDTNGDAVCSAFLVSSLVTTKFRTTASVDGTSTTVATWEDSRNGTIDVYGQNVNFDATCSLGLALPPKEVSPAGAAQPLVFTTKTTLIWDAKAVSGSDTFDLYRGDTRDLPLGKFGSCLQFGLTSSTATDGSIPGSGSSFTYLVSGKNSHGEGTLGKDSAGNTRNPTAHCP